MKDIGRWFALVLLFCLISCASPPAKPPVSFVPREFTRPEPSFKESMDHIAGAIVASMREHRWEIIAIGDFKANAGADTSLENPITDAITKNIGSVKGVSVVEKADSDRVLNFKKTTLYEMVHPTSDSTFVIKQDLIKEYGNKTYADMILGGTFTIRDGKIYLVAYFVDTKTGRIYQQKFDGMARNYNISQDKQPVVGFFDLGGGVLKDSQTGLKWTQSDNGSNINWYGARNYCANLNGGWRLPSTDELQGIYDPSGLMSSNCGTYQGRSLTCKVSPLFRLSSAAFWSNVLNGSSEALFVSLYDGQRFSARVDSHGGHGRVLCVRKEQGGERDNRAQAQARVVQQEQGARDSAK